MDEPLSSIVSVLGTLVGIAGLVISIITLKNTANIKKGIISEKIRENYPEKHNQFLKSINISILSLKDNGQKYYIVEDIIKNCKAIQEFYDNWDKKQKALIKKFLKYLEDLPDQNIDNETRKQLLGYLFKIEPMLERIGVLNDIRKI